MSQQPKLEEEGCEEIILPSFLPFIKSINLPLRKYLSEEDTLRSAREILALINFSECTNQTLQQEDVVSICTLLEVINNILDVTGKDMVTHKLLTPDTISDLISTLFKFLIDIHSTTVLEESVLSTLLECQEFLLLNFPSTFERFIGDISNMIPQLCQIFLSFFPNNNSKECCTETASIIFLPNICKFVSLEVHSADQCTIIQKYATNILKTLVTRHPIIAQHQNVFNNICNQIRYSSNEIKKLSLEIVTFIASSQSFDPTIHKNLINLIIAFLNGYQGTFPSYRTLEFDNLLADLLDSTTEEMIVILSYFGIEKIETINTFTSHLYWNICNSKSEKLKKQLIQTLCAFIDKYSDTDLDLVLKGITTIRECFHNQIFPNGDDFIILIKKYLSIHYSTTTNNNTSKKRESQTDSQGGKRRKMDEGDFVEDINLSFNAEFPSHEFGTNFFLIDSEHGQILFETLRKYVTKCSESGVDDDPVDINELYILLMSLCPFGPVKESLVLIELIHSFIEFTKNSTDYSKYPILIINQLFENNIPQELDPEKIEHIRLYSISRLEIHSKEMDEDIMALALKNVGRFYQLNLDETCKTVIEEQLESDERTIKVLIRCCPELVRYKVFEPSEISRHLRKFYSRNATLRSAICDVLQETIHECIQVSPFILKDWDFILQQFEVDKKTQLKLLKCVAYFIDHIKKAELELHFEAMDRYIRMIMDKDIEIVAFATSIFSIWITPNTNGITPIECIYELHDNPCNYFVNEIQTFLREQFSNKTTNQEHVQYFFYIIPLLKLILENCPNTSKNILFFFVETSLEFDQSSIVYVSLKKLANNKGILKYLSSSIGDEFYMTLFRYWVKNFKQKLIQNILSSLFDMEFKTIAKKMLKHVIPEMAVKGELLRFKEQILALRGNKSIVEVIIDCIEHIITEFIKVDKTPIESFEKFVRGFEITKIQATQVIQTAFKNIIMKLLNDTHKDKIKKLVNDIGRSVSKLLLSNISGISIKISKVFKDKTFEMKQRHHFNIIVNMIDVFGVEIGICFKELFELYQNNFLRCSFRAEVLDSFETFMMQHFTAKNKAVNMYSILSTLCKLVDESEFGSKLCLCILRLIQKNSEDLDFNLLHLSKRKELGPINTYIEQKIGKEPLDIKLEHILPGITQADVSVKQNALETLISILSENKEIIQKKIISMFELSESSVHNIINKLVSALLKNCSGTQDHIRLLSATALSEIGAIDPAALNIEPTIVANKEKTDVELIQFIFDHTEVCTYATSKINFVRQELLKVLKPLDKAMYQQRCTMYNMTEDHGLVSQPTSHSVPSVPIFKENLSNTKWMASWAKFLISKMKKFSTTRSKIFTAVRPILNADKVLVKMILPYLVHHVLLFGQTSDRTEIVTEISSVIDHDIEKSKAEEHSRTTEHAQTIFCLIDDLKRWFEMSPSKTSKELGRTVQKAEEVIKGISLYSLTVTAFNHSAFSRSLMYYEEYIRDQEINFKNLDKEIGHNLQRIYSQMKDRDSMSGLASVRTHSEINEILLDKEVDEKWTDARDLYEILLENQSLNGQQLISLLKCYMNLGQYNTMLQIINGYPLDKNTKAIFTLQAYWRLGSWNEIDSSLEQVSTPSFDTHIAKLFSFYVKRDSRSFDDCIIDAKRDILTSLSAGSSESYLRCYPDVLKLQVLSEIERGFRIYHSTTTTSQQEMEEKELSPEVEKFLQYLDKNLKITTNSSSDRELLHSVRRCIFKIHNLPENISEMWLHISKQARKEKQYHIAETALARSNLNSPLYLIEKAKLLYETGDVQKATPMIAECLKHDFSPSSSHSTQKKTDLLTAKVKLMTVNWDREHKQKVEVVRAYKEVIDIDKQWEEGYFFLASYLDKSYIAGLKKDDKTSTAADVNIIIQNYGQAIKYGIKNIFNALPRLLTLWMEHENSKTTKDSRVNDVIGDLISTLPDYVWAISLPQLYSRVSHPNAKVCESIKKILTKVLLAFPEESIWTIGCRSENNERKAAIKDIINSAASTRNINPLAKRVFNNQKQTLKGFHELCLVYLGKNLKPPTKLQLFKTSNGKPFNGKVVENKAEVSRQFKYLPTFVSDPCKHFIIPIQSLISVELQKANIFDDQQKIKSDYSPYSSSKVYIEQLSNDFIVMSSLQRPKKIGIIGSDGKCYNFLFKANDDIRKDNRMMDLNGVINRLLKRDKKTRNKRLYLRLFSAIPLSNNTGLVEWVPNTNVLRKIIDDEIAKTTKGPLQKELLEKFCANNSNVIPQNLYPKVYQYALDEYPAVFGRYFLHQFLEPNQWYQNRLNYVKTAAVWSMVGYIVGLGDRHSENILIDTSNGDTIHVDLAMLFESGKLLQVPEKVPFRLTRNMTDAMGVAGHEGAFRMTCEATLELLRKNNETLLNVLETFKHDPLLDWEQLKKKKEAKKAMNYEDINESHKIIASKLQGIVGDSVLPLSVAGQVDYLINEATNEDNLKSMYVWWMPFL